MTLDEARKLIAVPALHAGGPQEWADLGCGPGLFSRALLSLLPDASRIHAVDNRFYDFEEAGIQFIKADFEQDVLPLPALNGIMMANSLHFVNNKLRLLRKLKMQLRPGSIFILVEYDKAWPNPWVPYPLKFSSAGKLFQEAGLGPLEKIAERKSVYSRAKIYSAWCRVG
ncbi:methyltransferase family protein [Anseongella ginsenosidimutans]|uniref:Methyltransferase family protein n=1 Tax=Anseongella ginsenosidimutans TaxID=496056 RepID=A0A4R3KV80_9SPHI|nr:class I SAM-dependent methyltransferase [Anseongella ginsenosidimutans]QEC51850.1 class I SAM-dependent methyltransferase [Anseongella ginsenosidimutans]TCS89225.1 methyltransferase family protein [Anseongella ginsenosidimutans]